MSELKYKVGDRVRIKSLDWYNENRTKHGDIWFDNAVFVGGQSLYCGCELTIRFVADDSYYVIENDYYWTDEMIEGLVEEKTKFGTAAKPIEPKSNTIYLTPEMATKIDKELPSGNQNVWELPNGYQFVDENGNVINATKIVLEKKKKEFPKTFENCVSVLMREGGNRMPLEQMNTFRKLIDARNAYWQIAGEEMELGKPWKPDWDTNKNELFVIANYNGTIVKTGWYYIYTKILVFPTSEMRDTFYEAFKEEIEICKELL